MIRRILVAVLLLFAAACGQKQEPARESASATSRPGSSPQATSQTTNLAWTAPEGWVEEPPASGMRLSQYRLAKAEGDAEDAVCYVSHFPGTGGSVEQNLARWYQQFIQPDGKPTESVAKVNKAESNGLQQTTVDVSGTFSQSTTPMGPQGEDKPNFRMLAGVIETPAGPWFVKLIGPEKTVERWKDSFYEFMKSFQSEK
jgi:hypothetical protein